MRQIERTAGLVLALVGACGGAAPGAGAQPPRGGPGEHPPGLDRMLERDAERLGLDAATLDRARQIAEAARDAAQPLGEELASLHREMRALLDRNEPDEGAVMRQAERIGAVETELRKRRLRALLEIRGLLTPEQREQLVRIHAERGAAHGHPRRGPEPDAPPPEAP